MPDSNKSALADGARSYFWHPMGNPADTSVPSIWAPWPTTVTSDALVSGMRTSLGSIASCRSSSPRLNTPHLQGQRASTASGLPERGESASRIACSSSPDRLCTLPPPRTSFA